MSVSHDEYIGQILEAIYTDQEVSQRSLASSLGIALGLTNLLIKRLVLKGLVRVARVNPRRVRYLLTPTGIAEKTRMSQRALEDAIVRYRTARTRIEHTFVAVSQSFLPDAIDKPVVLCGTGELAEIGYVCLQDFDLRLAGVIDDCARQQFFNAMVYPDVPTAQRAVPATARYVIASVTGLEGMREALVTAGVGPAGIFLV